MTLNVMMTAAADRFLRRLLRFSGLPAGAGLRLAVSAGGCSGYQADVAAETGPRPGDSVLEIDGLKIFLPAQSRVLLDGATIDFADTPTQTGLTVLHPSSSSCGCASSAGASRTEARVDVASIRHAPARTPPR